MNDFEKAFERFKKAADQPPDIGVVDNLGINIEENSSDFGKFKLY